jgi:hypothetical protein
MGWAVRVPIVLSAVALGPSTFCGPTRCSCLRVHSRDLQPLRIPGGLMLQPEFLEFGLGPHLNGLATSEILLGALPPDDEGLS